MEFGIFDQNDRGARPVAEQYESRLQLAEFYDTAGFHAYHMSEHHATPLSTSPAAGVFLAAVAQRTRRLRFGTLVYVLPLHSPLRLAEEICTLDQLSGGRMEVGVGRGAVPHELAYHGVDPADAPAIYIEALEVLRSALTQEELTFHGRFFNYDSVPITLHPVQRPHPPLWYGVPTPDGAAWPARNAINVVCNGPAGPIRAIADRYRQEWLGLGRPATAMPFIGLNRAVVIADTDAEARAIAQRAWRRYHDNFMFLWNRLGDRPRYAMPTPDFAEMIAAGTGIAGSVRTVRDALLRQVAETGVTYLVSRFAFGDLSHAESLRSATRYAEEIMPALRSAERQTAAAA